MVLCQTGWFPDTGSGGQERWTLPLPPGRWHVFYLGTNGINNHVVLQQGDAKIDWLPDRICMNDPQTNIVIQRASGGSITTGGQYVLPNQILGIGGAGGNFCKGMYEPWYLGIFDSAKCFPAQWINGNGNVGQEARATMLYFDCYLAE
jgi:hypothetical protein